MPKLRSMSGADVLRALAHFGFTVISQKGSHAKLSRIGKFGNKEILTIPTHPELDKGTLKAIYRQASAFIPENDLRPFFMSQ